MQSKKWVLVASNGRAKILAVLNVRSLAEIWHMEHPEASLQGRELITDSPGRSYDAVGVGQHAMEFNTDPERQQLIKFAKQICNYIESAGKQGHFDQLVVIAAPAFLGQLRSQLGPATARLIVQEISKNVTRFNTKEIQRYLEE